jgi:beta-glucosidase
VEGIQSQGVAATPKHFVANFAAPGGRDSNAVHLSERYLREICFPAFEAAVAEAGALSIMAAYNSLDGIPCHGNRLLLEEVLRKEWGFKGFVVSDYSGVLGLHTRHGVARSPAEAARRALLSGVDVDLPDSPCFKLFKEGSIPEQALDEAAGRVLEVKLRLGLFDDPFTKDSPAVNHRGLAREVARQSMVLLKNDGDLLPLGDGLNSIAVLGPSADVPRLGDYSADGVRVVTPLMGIRERRVTVNHARGCEIAKITEADREKRIGRGMAVPDDPYSGFPEAVSAAKASDCAVLCLGNMRGTEGEARDRSDLDLPGVQEALIREVAKVNDRVVVVLITGSAVTMGDWIDDVEAVILAWYPGVEGGSALADVIFGDYNPGGRLPITIPRRAGQLPLPYHHRPSGRLEDYVDLRGEQAQFPFGFGLSYTRFEYVNLEIEKKGEGNDLGIRVTFDLRNAGGRKGDEVAQLYLRKTYSALARPLKELKKFGRYTLDAGEVKQVDFLLRAADLTALDPRLVPRLEKGEYEIMVGGSAADIRLTGSFEISSYNKK